MSGGSLPRGVVFDCDGTIADTESLSSRAWGHTLATYGYEPTSEDFDAVIGHPFRQNWAYFSARVDLGEQDRFRASLRERFIDLFDRELVLYPDAMATMRQLHAAGVPIAVASSSSHGHVERVLDRGGLTSLVGVIVGADDVERHKPDPQPYLTAADRIGVPAPDCAAIEDTAVGLAAANAAGMYTVGIVRAHGSPAGLSAAHRVVHELTADALRPGGRGQRPETTSTGS
ncbi:MAG: HAD family phosphatase [Nitriliruptor sp.]|nr:MAG: HAD family phosphatase [Nitriliruptor sp.]